MAARARARPVALGVLPDVVFLVAAVSASCLPYITGLGFYSDDWSFFAALEWAGGSYGDMFRAMMAEGMHARPVQAVLIATIYSLWGSAPLAFHLANGAMLAAMAALFYLCLRRLGIARPLALAVPLTFALLPHYSTDRFWIAAFQANAAMLLYFLSLYADLRFVQRPRGLAWAWKVVGAAALLGSVLAYEVTAALLLVNVAVLLYLTGARRQGRWVRAHVPAALAVAANVLVLAAAVGYKLSVTVRAGMPGGLRFRLLRIVTEAAPVHFVDYGLALPLKVGQVVAARPGTVLMTVSLVVGVAAATYLVRTVRRSNEGYPAAKAWAVFTLVGAVLFCAGYGMTVMTWEIGFHTTGPNNRTAIGATVGTAWIFVGVLGFAALALRSERARWTAFSTAVGLLAMSATLVVGQVGNFWVRAAEAQAALVGTLLEHHPTLPPGTTVLLDGICPFIGPAPVFVTGWDTRGMLRLTYGDRSLRGDVLKPASEWLPQGVRTMVFDDVIYLYDYGDALLAFHVSTGASVRLTDEEAARRYRAEIGQPGQVRCPPSTDGDGVDVF